MLRVRVCGVEEYLIDLNVLQGRVRFHPFMEPHVACVQEYLRVCCCSPLLLSTWSLTRPSDYISFPFPLLFPFLYHFPRSYFEQEQDSTGAVIGVKECDICAGDGYGGVDVDTPNQQQKKI